MIEICVEYITYHCIDADGECFGKECDAPESDCWCNGYRDIEYDEKGKLKCIHSICLGASIKEHIIAKTVKTFQYDEGDGIKIGRTFIPWEKIISLTINGEIKVSKQ